MGSADLPCLLCHTDGRATRPAGYGEKRAYDWHNPGMEDLVFDIVPDDGNSPLRDVVWEKYPTGALSRMELDIERWVDIDRKCGRLTHFIRPRDLDPELGPEDE